MLDVATVRIDGTEVEVRVHLIGVLGHGPEVLTEFGLQPLQGALPPVAVLNAISWSFVKFGEIVEVPEKPRKCAAFWFQRGAWSFSAAEPDMSMSSSTQL
ncbi:hypothetical protein [Achromobacter aegrifaciens]|uniref:hypothetical protein n=1 Tax=Achromobacter aegrifaciens TaxID=1287736 RepID=UPI0012E24D78|nr:hypothetical protein [Achromobacter aegrifaciens]